MAITGRITHAWTISCDESTLAARVESYVMTRRTEWAFKWCLDRREKRSQPLPDLPPEIREMIAINLQDMVYQETKQDWLRARRCADGECELEDHFTKGELARADPWGSRHYDDEVWTEKIDRHDSIVSDYLSALMLRVWIWHPTAAVRKFQYCRRVSHSTPSKARIPSCERLK